MISPRTHTPNVYGTFLLYSFWKIEAKIKHEKSKIDRILIPVEYPKIVIHSFGDKKGAISKIFYSSYLNVFASVPFAAIPCFGISIINEHFNLNSYASPCC